MRLPLLLTAACALLAACAGGPPPPAWQSQAHGDLARYGEAWLAGQARAADAEFMRARRTLAATGEAALVARVELTRCALEVASLQFEGCPGFESLRADAPAAERAYAAFLAGEAVSAADLPPAYRAVAAGGTAADVAAIPDPLSRLVAAGVLVRRGAGSPQLLVLASDTASAQGWRRPLLAWLGAQAVLARARGDAPALAALQRRMDLVSGQR